METVQEAETEKGNEDEGEVATVREKRGEEVANENRLEDVVQEEEVVEIRRKVDSEFITNYVALVHHHQRHHRHHHQVDSELISNNVALVHLLKGNIGIGVMAMPRYF